jgi:hypothetical protein
LRLVKNAELPQHLPPVVVDFFPSQTVIGIEIARGAYFSRWVEMY